jgi:hypothetical protein
MENLLSTVLAAMFIFISGYEKHKISRIEELV